MTQALQTSATGINVGQQQINVIANNVANINTVAYKSANMTFETLFSNTLSLKKKKTNTLSVKMTNISIRKSNYTKNTTSSLG